MKTVKLLENSTKNEIRVNFENSINSEDVEITVLYTKERLDDAKEKASDYLLNCGYVSTVQDICFE